MSFTCGLRGGGENEKQEEMEGFDQRRRRRSLLEVCLGDGGGLYRGAEVVREDGIGKVETREEKRMLGWRDACARVVCEG